MIPETRYCKTCLLERVYLAEFKIVFVVGKVIALIKLKQFFVAKFYNN